jgi:hypothetical protein
MADIERELRGLDAERALPEALYARLETALLEDAGDRRDNDGIGAELFDDVDAPRRIPPATRAALEDALIRPTDVPDRRVRVFLAAAAAVLLIVGATVALRGSGSSSNRNVASGPVRSVPAAGVPPVLQAPTTNPGVVNAASQAPGARGSAALAAPPATTSTTSAPSSGPSVKASAAAMPAAQISKVDPSSGPRRGGTIVTLTGSGFTGASGVLFGSASAVNFTVVSDTEIRVMVPASGAAQKVTVSVTYADGAATPTSDSGPFYTYT